jgi:hypothetical protein
VFTIAAILLARFPAAAHVTAPMTDLRTVFRRFRLAPVRLDTQRDVSISRLRLEIDVQLRSMLLSRRTRAVCATLIILSESAARKSTRTRPKGLSLYRDRIELDELDADLQRDKLICYVIAQDCLDADAAADFQFSFGAADGFNETPVFTPFVTYDGDVNHKLDIDQIHRVLLLQARLNDYHFKSPVKDMGSAAEARALGHRLRHNSAPVDLLTL